jgi:hypothetical protein
MFLCNMTTGSTAHDKVTLKFQRFNVILAIKQVRKLLIGAFPVFVPAQPFGSTQACLLQHRSSAFHEHARSVVSVHSDLVVFVLSDRNMA